MSRRNALHVQARLMAREWCYKRSAASTVPGSHKSNLRVRVQWKGTVDLAADFVGKRSRRGMEVGPQVGEPMK